MTSPDNYNPGQPNTGWGDVSEMATDFTNNGLIGLMFGGFARGLAGFISFLVQALRGVSGGLIDLTGLLANTQNTAQNAQETAAAASNLAVLYNFDIAANREKYPASGSFSFVSAQYAYSGTHVLALNPQAGYADHERMPVGLKFRVTPGEGIYMEWRQRRIGANFRARLNLRIFDAAGVVIAEELSPAQPLIDAPDNAWGQYKGTVTIPVGAYDAVPEIVLQSGSGQSLTGAWAFDNVITRRATEADLSAIQAELAGKANYSDIPTNVPLWHNVNASDDSVFPYSMLVYHTTATTSSSGNTQTYETKVPTFGTSSGQMDFGYIRSVRDREYTQVGFMTAKGGLVGSGPFEMWVHLYKMDPTTGTLTLLWSSGNVKSTVVAAGSGKMVRFAMPQIHADQGDVFAVGLVQRANVLNPSWSIYGITQPYTDQPAGVHPRGLSSRANVGTTFPSASTIPSASQLWTDENTPWFFLG